MTNTRPSYLVNKFNSASLERTSDCMLTEIQNITSIPLLLEEKFSISIIHVDGTVSYVNQQFCDLSLYSKKELIGQHIKMLSSDSDFEVFITKVLEIFKTEKLVQQKIQRKNKTGDTYWLHATIIPILNDEGIVQQIISFETDTTSEVLMELKYEQTLHELKNIENALDQSTVIVITDQKGMITYVNDKFCALSKYSAEELIGQSHRIVNSGHHSKEFFKNMWRTIRNGSIWTGDIKNRAKDGSTYWVNTTIIPFLNERNIPYQYIAIRTDISDRKKAESALEIALKNDFQSTVKNLQNGIFKYQLDDDKIIFTLLEGKLTESLNLSTADLTEYIHAEQNKQNYRKLLQASQGEANHFELNYLTYTFLIYLSPIMEDNRVIEVVGTISDITERKLAEQKVKRMAYYDFLTDLPNHRLFEKKLEKAIHHAEQLNEQFAVMFIDLDRFKYINDSMGNIVGDQILKQIAQNVQGQVRRGDLVGRQGGDEFVILLPNIDKKEASKIAERLIESLGKPLIFNDIDIFVNTSIGISLYPEDGVTSKELIRHANIAMYQSKQNEWNSYHFFTKALYQEAAEKSLLSSELRWAIEKNQLTLHYQPQIDLKTGKISGVEALVRWHHPEYGMISPARFIPLAEESGFIISIGKWVLEKACLQAKEWQKKGLPPIQISINVSPREFRQPSFIKQVKDTLKTSGLEPCYLNLEITENIMSDVHHCKITLEKLRELGVKVSVDDFGTGYSSLSYLNDFPLTHLKIDQAFVRELNKSNRAIVKTIISLAMNLNLKVVAEGVETEEQASFLNSLACDNVQGYLYSKPLPHDQIEPLLTKSF